MDSESRTLRPRPRKTFDLPSAESSQPGTPAVEEASSILNAKSFKNEDSLLPSQSMMNLTSPTLFGIYSPTAFDGVRDDLNTPWGTGAQTPDLRNASRDGGAYLSSSAQFASEIDTHLTRKHGFKGFLLPFIRRSLLLFLFGMAYGGIITQLHGHPTVAGHVPVNVQSIDITRSSLGYLGLWGVAGVLLGSLQPWFDLFWGEGLVVGQSPNRHNRAKENGFLEWSPIFRSIGAFVGIAFAIRKLPWQSTLQVSLTLALVNPVLWYLIDRSKPGFILSTVIGIAGMFTLLGINPTLVPSPATTQPSSSAAAVSPGSSMNGSTISNNATVMGMTQEGIAVGTWIASVLFCSCVCFGNIGRRLA